MDINTLEKIKIIRENVIKIFETLSLFVVIKKTEVNQWDFVFAGNNLDDSKNLKVIAEIINKELNENEIINVARLVLLNSEDPFAKNFNSTFKVGSDNGYLTINDGQINNISIKEAYLFFSK